MADGVDPPQHQPPPLQKKGIRSELDGWSVGEFSRMNFWRRGHSPGEIPKTKPVFNYTGEDLLQNGMLDVESRLGEGGMGQVFLARNKEDGTVVAVKVGKDEGPDGTGIKSQLTEIIARDRLPDDGHENIVKSYGFCDLAPGCPIFLEACNGGDLFEAAVDGRLLKSVEILSLVQGLVSALDFLHEHGIIHCDVKAENVLLQTNEKGGYTPKLTDFGGAMAAGENRHGGGTFGYTAPEVIFGTRPAHGSQDAWAVGHMLLIMLTKRRHRASNMFRHSRLLTEADYELKATMTSLGQEDLFERYLTFRNMRDLGTRNTLLSSDVFNEDLAELPEVFTGIRRLLHLEAANRPPMAVVHGWLGLVIADLNDKMEECGASPEHVLDDSPSKERHTDSPADIPTSTAASRTEARLCAPTGLPTSDAKDNPCLLPPPDFPVIGIKNGPHLSPPPGFSSIGTKHYPYLPPPPADVSVPLSRENETTEPIGAENEARIPTRTANGGEIGSCPSATSPAVVAETEGLAAPAYRFGKLGDLPPQEGDVPVSVQHTGGQSAIAVCPIDGDIPAAAEADVRVARQARNSSGAYHSGVDVCSRPRTAVLGMGFPAAIHQYDVTPRTSDVALCGTSHQRAAPTTEAHQRGAPRVFQATNAAVPPAYYHGAPASYTGGSYGVSAAGFGAQGGPSSRPPPSRAPRWTEQGGGQGRWTGHVAGGHGAAWQEGNAFPNRHRTGGVQAHRSDRKETHHHHNLHNRHIGSTVRAEVPGKSRMKKSKNRRGGHKNWRPDHPQQTAAGCGDVMGRHGGPSVPHAIAVNGAELYYPGGGGFYPLQWQRHPVGIW